MKVQVNRNAIVIVPVVLISVLALLALVVEFASGKSDEELLQESFRNSISVSSKYSSGWPKGQSASASSPHANRRIKNEPGPVTDDYGNPILDRVYVINRAKRIDRLQVILPMLHHVGIYPQIWTAKEIPTNPTKGCLYSHKNIMRDIFINNYRWALVLEDDVDFDVSLRSQLAKVMRDLVHAWDDSKMNDIDVIYIGTVNEDSIETGYKQSPTTNLTLSTASRPSGNFGYILSYQGAINYHVGLEALGDAFAVDKWWDNGEDSAKLNAKIVYPQLVKPHLKSPSDLRPQSEVDKWQGNYQPTFENSVFALLYGEGTRIPTKQLFGLESPVKQMKGDGEKFGECAYVVEQGDSLSRIASKFGMTLEEIHSLNPKLTDKSGKPVILYAGSTKVCVAGRSPVVAPECSYYVSVRGDTLAALAERYSIPSEVLKNSNQGMAFLSKLKPGTSVCLPPSVTL